MLTTCPECDHKVSDQAGACPRCGYPIGSGPPTPTHVHVQQEVYAGPERSPTGTFLQVVGTLLTLGSALVFLNSIMFRAGDLVLVPIVAFVVGLVLFSVGRILA